MQTLASTSDKLRLTTTAATVTVDVQASWVDNAAGVATPGRTNTAIISATTTDIVPVPGASTQRIVVSLQLHNKHASLAVLLAVLHTDGTTVVQEYLFLLPAGYTLSYEAGSGWQVSPTVPPLIVPTVVSSGTSTTVAGPLASDQMVIWQSATSGTKTTNIPTATGSLRQIRVVDAQGTAGTAGQSVVIVPASGSVVGTPLTDRIIDAYGVRTLLDTSIGWVIA